MSKKTKKDVVVTEEETKVEEVAVEKEEGEEETKSFNPKNPEVECAMKYSEMSNRHFEGELPKGKFTTLSLLISALVSNKINKKNKIQYQGYDKKGDLKQMKINRKKSFVVIRVPSNIEVLYDGDSFKADEGESSHKLVLDFKDFEKVVLDAVFNNSGAAFKAVLAGTDIPVSLLDSIERAVIRDENLKKDITIVLNL